MDFRRIDKNTVQCILSEEEMSAYGFRIEDFFSNQEKAKGVSGTSGGACRGRDRL